MQSTGSVDLIYPDPLDPSKKISQCHQPIHTIFNAYIYVLLNFKAVIYPLSLNLLNVIIYKILVKLKIFVNLN